MKANDLTDLVITSFIINENEMVKDIQIGNWTSNSATHNLKKKYNLHKTVDVPSNWEVKVKIRATSVLNKHVSLTWRKNFRLFTESATIYIVNNDANLIVDFQSFGNSRYNDFGKEIHKNFRKNMEILFPGDGYIIFVTIK